MSDYLMLSCYQVGTCVLWRDPARWQAAKPFSEFKDWQQTYFLFGKGSGNTQIVLETVMTDAFIEIFLAVVSSIQPAEDTAFLGNKAK